MGESRDRNEHGVGLIPAAEDLKRAEMMLERERNAGPHPGKARMIQALEARIQILRRRMESEGQ